MSKNPHPPLAKPKFGKSFDPWNSSSTGHQRAENGPSTHWRASRNLKLNEQFVAGHTGGKRMSDTCGAGSEDYDEKLKMVVSKEVRARAKASVMDMLAQPGSMMTTLTPTSLSADDGESLTAEDKLTNTRAREDEEKEEKRKASRGIFDGLVIYVNGSTHPLVSDHKLKRLLVENGANMSLHLGRRKVTHVIIGRPAGIGTGAGGGLAARKLEKEIRRIGGCGVKYVGVEWVLESMKAGCRLPEAKFACLKIASKGQQSVYNLYAKE